MEKIEQLIIKNVVENPSYAKVVSPFLNKDYFDDVDSCKIVEAMTIHMGKYKTVPSYEQLVIDISSNTTIDTDTVDKAIEALKDTASVKNIDKDLDWLIDTTEKHFQMSAIKKATFEAMEVFTTKEKRNKLGELPEIMRNALKLSFKNTVGTVWGTDASIEEQFKYYHSKDNRYPIGTLESFNRVMRGGAQKKRLHVVIAGTGVGKTMALINFATQFASTGLNVLYVTLEISEAEVAERIDANRLDVESMTLPLIEKEKYVAMVKKARETTQGKIVVKEYPTTGANVNHVRALLDEVELKEGIKIDFLMLDYLNICASIRFHDIGNSYINVKSIAEEFRGLAVERNIGVFTATQSKREMNGNVSDFDIGAISESFGTAHTADWICALIQPSELRDKNVFLVKQLKSRYGQINGQNEKFLVGADKDKQTLYDRGEKAQEGLILDTDDSKNTGTVVNNLPNKFKAKHFNEEDAYEQVDWNFADK